MITASLLRERLSRTAPPEDPTAMELPERSGQWPDGVRQRLQTSLVPAGVLIAVINRGAAELSLLLTRRSAELRHHAGQVSFPGGRMEPGDASVVETALREAREEVGIAPSQVELVGYLAPMPTITGFVVTPVIGLVPGDVDVAVDRNEVELAFEVPLPFLQDPGNRLLVEREFFGGIAEMPEFRYAGQRIWGATAFIIERLLKAL